MNDYRTGSGARYGPVPSPPGEPTMEENRRALEAARRVKRDGCAVLLYPDRNGNLRGRVYHLLETI